MCVTVCKIRAQIRGYRCGWMRVYCCVHKSHLMYDTHTMCQEREKERQIEIESEKIWVWERKGESNSIRAISHSRSTLALSIQWAHVSVHRQTHAHTHTHTHTHRQWHACTLSHTLPQSGTGALPGKLAEFRASSKQKNASPHRMHTPRSVMYIS